MTALVEFQHVTKQYKSGFKAEGVKALDDVSFTLEAGKIYGLLGPNGSGKSTMLRAIAGIFSPNSGSVDLHGNSVALLAIGVGFQKELSGRENILLSGMLLGFSEAQIRERMDDIIAFCHFFKVSADYLLGIPNQYRK